MSKKPQEKEILKAFGMRKTQLGWQAVEYKIQGGKVLEEVASEPDFRAIALEKHRQQLARYWNE